VALALEWKIGGNTGIIDAGAKKFID